MKASHRLLWTLIDQGLSSSGNFGIALVAARSLGASGFSAFSISFLVYVVSIGLTYSFVGEPFQVLHSSSPQDQNMFLVQKGALGLALLMSVLMAFLVSLLGVGIGGVLEAPMVVVGFILPGLLIQDSMRHFFFAQARPARAAFIDFIWLAAMVLALLGLSESQIGLHSPAALLAVWGASAAFSSVVGLLVIRIAPSVARSASWYRESKNLGWNFSLDFLFMTGAAQIVVLLLPLIVGLDAVGALKGAQLMFGPITILISGLRALGVPEASRHASEGHEFLFRFTKILAGSITVMVLAYSVLILTLPDSVAEFFLGASQAGSSPLLPFVALDMLGRALALAPFVSLRAMGSGDRILRARAIDAPSTLMLGLAGALIGGAEGAAAGLGSANILVAGAWWRQFVRAIEGREVAG